jgi:hypothetical protein
MTEVVSMHLRITLAVVALAGLCLMGAGCQEEEMSASRQWIQAKDARVVGAELANEKLEQMNAMYQGTPVRVDSWDWPREKVQQTDQGWEMSTTLYDRWDIYVAFEGEGENPLVKVNGK